MGLSYLQALDLPLPRHVPDPRVGGALARTSSPSPRSKTSRSGSSSATSCAASPTRSCEQVEQYLEVGCDQVGFGLPIGLPHEIAMESVKTFGEKVIPNFDTDPVHRTTRYRRAAGGGVFEGTELH